MFKKLKYFFAGIQVCKLPGMLSSLDFIEPDFRSVMDKIMGLPGCTENPFLQPFNEPEENEM